MRARESARAAPSLFVCFLFSDDSVCPSTSGLARPRVCVESQSRVRVTVELWRGAAAHAFVAPGTRQVERTTEL